MGGLHWKKGVHAFGEKMGNRWFTFWETEGSQKVYGPV